MTDDLLLNNFNVHDHLKDKTVEELQQINSSDRLPYAVAVINLTGSLNVGMIIRTACNLGAERVIVFGKRKYDARSCVGSHNYIPVERVDGFVDNRAPDPILDPQKFRETMYNFDYVPVFIETGGEPISNLHNPMYRTVREKPCLVFGSEGDGIPAEILKQGVTYEIPQLGVIRSYNVAAAASIAMWEMYRIIKENKKPHESNQSPRGSR